jgi:hypothetical protein
MIASATLSITERAASTGVSSRRAAGIQFTASSSHRNPAGGRPTAQTSHRGGTISATGSV